MHHGRRHYKPLCHLRKVTCTGSRALVSASFLCAIWSKQRKFSNKNYRLQKLIHVMLHILCGIKSGNIILRLFYHHCLRIAAQQHGRQYIFDWLNSLFHEAVFVQISWNALSFGYYSVFTNQVSITKKPSFTSLISLLTYSTLWAIKTCHFIHVSWSISILFISPETGMATLQ